MPDLGFWMGALGLGTAIIAILYARSQAGAAQAQARETAHMFTLQSNSELLGRTRDIRRRMLQTASIRNEFTASISNDPVMTEMVQVLMTPDGVESYIVYRDALDIGQDAFFLRKRGVMTDEHWYVWSNVHFAIWSKFPGFERTFRISAKTRRLHPEFVLAYERFFGGEPFNDP